jgi:DNA-binding transcriptional ArsR family regulator
MPPIDWQRVAEAEMHPLRLKLLKAIHSSSEPCSPNQLSQELGERLGNVSYHVAKLVKGELIEMVKTEPRRGAVEHFYGTAPNA